MPCCHRSHILLISYRNSAKYLKYVPTSVGGVHVEIQPKHVVRSICYLVIFKIELFLWPGTQAFRMLLFHTFEVESQQSPFVVCNESVFRLLFQFSIRNRQHQKRFVWDLEACFWKWFLQSHESHHAIFKIGRSLRPFIHEGWTGDVLDGNDLALMKLREPSAHTPIPLPPRELVPGRTLTAMGWGVFKIVDATACASCQLVCFQSHWLQTGQTTLLLLCADFGYLSLPY